MSTPPPTDPLLDTAEVRTRLGKAGAATPGVERDRVFSALHAKMFGSGEALTIGRFRVDRRLGAGAMGVVYAAYDPELDRSVALKVLRVSTTDATAAARIEREARALARLRHPNVVTVYEVGRHQGDRFIAMDLVDGKTLGAWLGDALSWRQVLGILIEAGRGLAAAHAAGLVHRDFKPDNVLVEDDHARVVDFGLARPALPSALRAEISAVDLANAAASVDSDPSLTKTGAVVGTPAYMAPEAFAGEADARCDQFSFCVTLYEALYGTRPFEGASIVALLEAMRVGKTASPARSRGSPKALRRVLLRGLSFAPEDRWPDMDALLDALARYGQRSRVRTLSVVGGAGILVGAVVVSASTAGESSACAGAGAGMVDVWNEGKKREIGTAFAATGLPYADDAWSRARASADRYAKAWVAMRKAACEATFERGEQSEGVLDARMWCLDRRLEELEALTNALSAPDQDVVAQAVTATQRLGELSDCADEGLMRAEQARAATGDVLQGPPPMYARLARATTGLRTAKYADALTEAQALAAEADAAGYLELAARAHLLSGLVQDRLAQDAAALASVKTAIAIAERLGDDDIRARAQTTLVSLLAGRAAVDDATDWVRLTYATLARLGEPPRLKAGLMDNEARVLSAAGRYEEAVARRREALSLRLASADPDESLVADAHRSIGSDLVSVGRPDEGLAELRQALALRISAVGEHHPDVALAYAALAGALQELGRLPEAAQAARQAIELGTRALGPDHPDVGRATMMLAIALAQGEDLRASIPYFRRAVEIFEAAQGPRAVAVGHALGNLGRVLAFLENDPDAVPVLQRALAIYTEVLGPDHPDNLYVLNNLATALLHRGQLDEALAAAQRAAEIGDKAFQGDHPTRAEALAMIGTIQRQRGALEPAVVALRGAVEMSARLHTRPAAIVPAQLELASAYRDAGAMGAAIVEVQRARDALRSDPVAHKAWLAIIDRWLADPAAAP